MLQLLLESIAARVLFFALHLNNTGSFPPPLSAEEERTCLLACAEGDKAARDKLVEHNLRLVVHVIKKCCYKIPGAFSQGKWHRRMDKPVLIAPQRMTQSTETISPTRRIVENAQKHGR